MLNNEHNKNNTRKSKQINSNNLSTLIKRFKVILSLTFLCVLIDLTSAQNCKDVEFSYRIRKPGLLFTINCNSESCQRAIYAYEKYGRNLSMYENVEVKFVNTKLIKGYENMTILALQKSDSLPIQLHENTMTAYYYFIKKTVAQFYWRTTDDAYFDIKSFLKLIDTMDPYSEKPIMRGQILTNYVHGGPGWIVNRVAARKWLNDKQYWAGKVFGEKISDDVVAYSFLIKNNIPFAEANIEKIIGPFIDEKYEDIMTNKKWDQLEPCKRDPNDLYYVYMFPLREAIIWHGGVPSNYAVVNGEKIIGHVPSNVIVYSNQFSSKLCLRSDYYDHFKLKPMY